ncbi:uncharacterized protein LOC110006451 [Amborella trichopoda]|uniref:uncharacterized protein LOC110006451 n=1 Tax=Amborella trichopoda TaxID=13333 RepID=UPI0009BE08D5|nr:uncharacterized protein LOC110006451 [Amborella trichopoda]|eukprot:XP_020517579.1 uncharacterized protein LOC110006451 [Amborella trichopoda]
MPTPKPSPCPASSFLNVTMLATRPSPFPISSSLSPPNKTLLFILQPLQNHNKTRVFLAAALSRAQDCCTLLRAIPLNQQDSGALMLGITGSNGNSTQASAIYSWSFDVGYKWKNLHSMPVDPRTFEVKNGSFGRRINVICKTHAALIWGTGIGAIATLSMLLVWNLFMTRYKSSAADYGGKKPVDLGYEKIEKAREKGWSFGVGGKMASSSTSNTMAYPDKICRNCGHKYEIYTSRREHNPNRKYLKCKSYNL